MTDRDRAIIYWTFIFLAGLTLGFLAGISSGVTI